LSKLRVQALLERFWPPPRVEPACHEKFVLRKSSDFRTIPQYFSDGLLVDLEDTKAVLDWLHKECTSWCMMTDLRNIMSGIFTKAQEWELLPDTFANPIVRVKLPKKWEVYERRILSEQETVRVLARIEDPHRLICEICLATGARISEVTGLQLKHVNLEKGFVRIEQRHWRGDIDGLRPDSCRKSEGVFS